MKSKLNHVMKVLLIVSILALWLVAANPFQGETPPPPDAAPLTVPVEVQVALTGAVVFLLTAGLKALSQAFPNIPIDIPRHCNLAQCQWCCARGQRLSEKGYRSSRDCGQRPLNILQMPGAPVMSRGTIQTIGNP